MEVEALLLEPGRLAEIARSNAAAYRAADPFPHVVLDRLFPDDVLDEIAASFPCPEDESWVRWDDGAQNKKRMLEVAAAPIARRIVAELNGPHVATFLEQLTGIDGVIPDPHLVGGGLHQIESGGFLKVHADFNLHPRLRLERRLNLLVYLNRGWRPEWGGALELWSTDMSECRVRVLPVFNRTVIFSTTSTSYHGHPDPLRCPPNMTRRSLALYYYTAPETPDLDDHSTLFRRRQGERFKDPTSPSPRERLRRWIPPAVIDASRSLRQRFRNSSQ